MDEQTQTDVVDSASPSVEAPDPGAVSAPAGVQGELETPVEKPTAEAAAPFQVPETDDDLKGQETNPHVQSIIQMRQELRARDQRLDSFKPLESWKDVASTIGDPSLAQSAHELVSAIHTPVKLEERADYPSGFTTRPFLEKIDTDSPGTARQIFSDLLRFPDVDPQNRPSTVVREFLRDIGLNPDRMDDYRNIDQLRASSGVVTAEQLGKIPEQYHEAFRSLSREAQEDLLALRDSSPVLAEEHLRNAQRALASESFERQQQERERQQQEADERALHQRIETSVQNDITAEVKSLSDSIHQSLSSQWKPSSVEAVNSLEYAKILSTIATLQNPAYRFVAEQALKSVGVDLAGFDNLANRWLERRSAYTAFNETGDKWQAQRALSDATLARQQMLVKLNDYALRLAKAGGDRLQNAASQIDQTVAAASGRFVPNGNGNGAQGGSSNPYANNPFPIGTPEYHAHLRKIDHELNQNNASVFGS